MNPGFFLSLSLGVGSLIALVAISAILVLRTVERLLSLSRDVNKEAMADAQHSFEVAMQYMKEVTQRAQFAAGLREGVNPHVLDPETFGPTGMARKDEEDFKVKQKTAQSVLEHIEDDALALAEEHYIKTTGQAAELGMFDEMLSGPSRTRPS